MYTPLEHDYIGLAEAGSMESSEKTVSSASPQVVDDTKNVLNLKQTELRLGLPGSLSPERRAVTGTGLSLSLKGVEDNNGLLLHSFVPGAKRGFSDASGKWGFGGSQADWAHGGVLFSPRPANGGNKPLAGMEIGMHNSGSAANATKDGVPPTPPKPLQEKKPDIAASNDQSPPSKTQVVGWPPIRSFRKNTMAANPVKNIEDKDGKSGPGCLYVKVSMDGAPYLRKVDLKTYSNYRELSAALEKMFSCFTSGQCGSHGVQGRDSSGLSESRLMDVLRGSECVLTFEDKDGDWMLVGDVPWDMFIDSCKRLRIMKGSEAIGLAPKAMEKCRKRD